MHIKNRNADFGIVIQKYDIFLTKKRGRATSNFYFVLLTDGLSGGSMNI